MHFIRRFLSSFTMVFFNVFGVSLVSGRLVSAVFSVLSLWVVFELSLQYVWWKSRVDLSCSFGGYARLLLAFTHGFVQKLCLFSFSRCHCFSFIRWLNNHQNKMLVFSGLALGFGFLTKYQVLAAGVVMVVSLMILGRGQLKRLFSRFTLLIVTAAIVVVPWIVIVYNVYASQTLKSMDLCFANGQPWKVTVQRPFSVPIFYLVEMTWPYSGIHPISLLLYIVGLLGLGLFVWRQKSEDKFVFIWFVSIFVFFTLISNREWRYVLPLFPALAISASVFILFVYS